MLSLRYSNPYFALYGLSRTILSCLKTRDLIATSYVAYEQIQSLMRKTYRCESCRRAATCLAVMIQGQNKVRDRPTCTWGPSPGRAPTEAVREETWLSMLAYMDLRMGETQTPPKLGTCRTPPGIGGSASGICTVCSQSGRWFYYTSFYMEFVCNCHGRKWSLQLLVRLTLCALGMVVSRV